MANFGCLHASDKFNMRRHRGEVLRIKLVDPPSLHSSPVRLGRPDQGSGANGPCHPTHLVLFVYFSTHFPLPQKSPFSLFPPSLVFLRFHPPPPPPFLMHGLFSLHPPSLLSPPLSFNLSPMPTLTRDDCDAPPPLHALINASLAVGRIGEKKGEREEENWFRYGKSFSVLVEGRREGERGDGGSTRRFNFSREVSCKLYGTK